MHELTNIPAEINRLHSEILDAAKTTIEKAIRIGKLLLEAKQNAGHGNWLAWIKDNISFDVRTAQRYIRVYEHRDLLKNDNVSHLSAAYRLLNSPAEPSEPLPDADTLALIEQSQPQVEDNDAVGFLIALNTLLESSLEHLKAFNSETEFNDGEKQKLARSIALYDQALYHARNGIDQLKRYVDEPASREPLKLRVHGLAAVCDLLNETTNLFNEHHIYAELLYGKAMQQLIATPDSVRLADAFSELRKTKDFKKNPDDARRLPGGKT
jgi:hypothetical protein